MLFEAIIFVPLGVYLWIRYPDWSMMYTLNTADSFRWLPIWLFYFYFVAAAIGYTIGWCLVKLERMLIFWVILALAIFDLVTILVWGFDRLIHVGTFEQYLTGTSPLFYQGKNLLGFTGFLILAGAVFIAGLVFIFYKTMDMKNKDDLGKEDGTSEVSGAI